MSYVYGHGYFEQQERNGGKLEMTLFEGFLEAHWWHYQDLLKQLSKVLYKAAADMDSDAVAHITDQISRYGAYLDIIEGLLSEYRTNGIRWDSEGNIVIEDFLERRLEF